jgi:rhamnopyranosyl-N-acetylglucosaminyl-diphospho-decaprenol beta-1,3/1,4-galactofuranosyltransferase
MSRPNQEFRVFSCSGVRGPRPQEVSTASQVAGIVVTFNRRAILQECVNALLSQTLRLGRIIVVDNGSTDGTGDMLRREYAESVTLVASECNLGPPGAFARGLTLALEAGCEWFWLMDDDCVARPDGLELLLSVALQNPRALYGPRVLDPKTGEATWHRWEKGVSSRVVEVPGVAWGGLLVSRETVTAIGLPREDIFINGDDVEYCLRARVKGYRTFAVYDSVAYHPAPQFTRWGRVGKRHLIVYPHFRSPERAYYYVRNWVFLVRSYWAPGLRVPLLRVFRDMACLALSGTVPLRTWTRALRDGWMMGEPQ